MWYGFVVRNTSVVTASWPEVKALVNANPYASFRKFYTEEAAWEFVRKKFQSKTRLTHRIVNYGETIDSLSVDLNFFITEDAVLANVILTPKLNLSLMVDEPNISITRHGDVILIRNGQLSLKADSLRDRAVALHSLLRIIGPIIDVNILVPDMSTFYLLQYRGDKVLEFVKLRELMESRVGRIGITVENKQYVKLLA